jgi:ATP-binding cassette subfamily F protein 3
VDTVLLTDSERIALIEEEKALSKLEEVDPLKLQKLYLRMAEIEANTAEVRAQTILGGLGFS